MVSSPPIGTSKVFVDTSVLFAASHSFRGSARELIEAGLRSQVTIVLSPFVIQETRRNLASKAPEALPLFEAFLRPGLLRVVQPSPALVEQVATVIVLKDAPVVAGQSTLGQRGSPPTTADISSPSARRSSRPSASPWKPPGKSSPASAHRA